MQCDECKQKKATVFFTQIIDGKMQKANLCEPCSKAMGVTDPTGFGLAQMLSGLGTPPEESVSKERACPACGLPQNKFRKTGRFGCSRCYATFADALEHLLKPMHKGGTRHVGKRPVSCQLLEGSADRMAELQEALRAAVEGEQYEEAARLRDELKRSDEFRTPRSAPPKGP